MFRVVIYAEGAGELAGTVRTQHAPGSPLRPEELGAAHLLVRRCLERTRDLDPSLIQFEEPLRTRRGKLARGSDLYTPETLRLLLTWADVSKEPELSVVLVDQDADAGRQESLTMAIQDIPVETVIGVAIEEFEAWLIADPEALKSVFRQPVRLDRSPEKLRRREAKEQLQQWSEQHASSKDAAELRRKLAEQCDLDTVAQQCSAFADFLNRLKG
ncbi:MAG TPA: DUF4276 family protein [Myxococcus sp.]|nr:DUF4276 family protein [Myxococcus sp.]